MRSPSHRSIRFIVYTLVMLLTAGFSYTMEQDTNRPGMDYKNFGLSSPDPKLCEQACMGDPNCRAYTYVKPTVQRNPWCWLKSGTPSPLRDTCCVSDIMQERAVQTPGKQPAQLTTQKPVLDRFQQAKPQTQGISLSSPPGPPQKVPSVQVNQKPQEMPVITVVSPKKNDYWYKGLKYAIEWKRKGDMNNAIRIDLIHKTTQKTYQIAGRAPNSGFYEWKIPCCNYFEEGDYKIRVTADIAKKLYGEAEVGIQNPSLNIVDIILAGQDRSTLCVDATYLIRWQPSSGYVDPVRVTVADPNGTLVFDKTVPNTSSKNHIDNIPWPVPESSKPGTYTIKLSSTDSYVLSEKKRTLVQDLCYKIAGLWEFGEAPNADYFYFTGTENGGTVSFRRPGYANIVSSGIYTIEHVGTIRFIRWSYKLEDGKTTVQCFGQYKSPTEINGSCGVGPKSSATTGRKVKIQIVPDDTN